MSETHDWLDLSYNEGTGNHYNPNTGNALVRDAVAIPVAATLPLFLVGATGLIGLRRRRV